MANIDKPKVKIGTVTLYNCDCMDLLSSCEDKAFSLSICDPPYGLGGKWVSTGKSGFTLKPHEVEEMNKWDIAPAKEYFTELERVSKKRIIWGANYFLEHLGSCRGPIIWDKGQHGFVLADGEFAWTDFDKPLRICPCGPSIRSADKKTVQGRWHGTQKPAYLYRWLLERYAKPGQNILDTHLGSGTHAMACLDLGFELTACEISKKYFDEAVKHIYDYLNSHEKIFDIKSAVKLTEESLF
jgi:site-specific DNA-methyltransferase (adenine-specific)